jgi:PAS domain S-box-containing protein
LAKIKQGEELLKKEREVFFAILYNARYGILMADPDDRCLYVNPEFTNITGYTFQDVPTVPDWFNNAFLDSKYRQRAIENWKKERLRGETVDRESNIICKNGKTKRLEIRAVFLEDKNVVVAFYDVTERKRAEEALRQSEEKYRTILESIEEGYYEVDLAGNFTFLNDSMCRVFGYPREELMGMNDREYTDQGTMRKLFQAFNEVYRTGRPGKVFDNEIVRKDGTKRHVETSISLRKDASGRPIGFRGIIRDITDRKRIEEQLFQAEKLRAVGEMASGVAHDFNNTLAAILGNTQLLLYTAQDEELKETLKIIEKVAKDSSQTVRRLQDFTRKRVPQEVFKVDINAVVKDSIEITKPKWKDEAQGKGIPVEMVSHFGDIPLASGSASELREVITNMILNAIEAMPGGGRVEIRTFRKRRNVFIQILDTGVGIAEETKKRIFDPFFTTKPFTNTGLGLSMSYGIVKRFGGEIEVESNVGQGTTFTIALPMGEEQKEEPVDSPPIKKGRRARILVIDDDEFVRDVLSRTLAQADHQVTLAESGGKGVQLFKEGEFDMVLTDLGMPGVSGWEVCRMIKGMSPQTPVGMVTGWGDEKNRDKKEEYGLDFFISKPFDFAQILNVVAETMESRKE